MSKRFYIPTKPYSLIDALNRCAAATGSIYNAGAAHSADYNGHRNGLCWNGFRKYYVGEYTWAGRNVFTRSSDFKHALDASIVEFDRQGRGAVLYVDPLEKDIPIAEACERLLPWSEEAEAAENAKWMTWAYKEVNSALRQEKQFGVSASLLLQATDEAHYKALVDAAFVELRNRRHPPQILTQG